VGVAGGSLVLLAILAAVVGAIVFKLKSGSGTIVHQLDSAL
jgi:hypothetical protein